MKEHSRSRCVDWHISEIVRCRARPSWPPSWASTRSEPRDEVTGGVPLGDFGSSTFSGTRADHTSIV